MKRIIILFGLWIAVSSFANPTKPSVYMYNETTGQVIVNTNNEIVRPIASVTKIMTAMVALDYDNDLKKLMHLKPGARLVKGNQTRENVLTSLLVKSDNIAADSIADDYPGGREAFLLAMNNKAQALGLKNTFFDDPSGLSAKNVSTVEEIGSMMQVAALYPFIRTASTMEQARISQRRGKKNTNVILNNTNQRLLSRFKEIVAGKTGFTRRAGFTIGLAVESAGQKFVIVVLGARTKDHRTKLINDIIHTHLNTNDTRHAAGL
jgi:D-alanyl-D-alanine carboxypeptidase